jgi:hypothetical protein
LPLPTTAAQNGAWNVGINGTPNVNVANTPGVNINNTPNVSIAGTPTVRNSDEPGRGAFQTTVQVGFGQGLVGVPIPAGTRLVIDYVSIHGNASGPGTVVPTILFESSINSQPSVNYYISPVLIGDVTTDQWRASEPVKIYADSLAMGVGYAGVVPTTLSFAVDISGHLINMP